MAVTIWAACPSTWTTSSCSLVLLGLDGLVAVSKTLMVVH